MSFREVRRRFGGVAAKTHHTNGRLWYETGLFWEADALYVRDKSRLLQLPCSQGIRGSRKNGTMKGMETSHRNRCFHIVIKKWRGAAASTRRTDGEPPSPVAPMVADVQCAQGKLPRPQ